MPLVLFDPLQWPVKIPFYTGVLAVLSINRFQLAAASAVVPRLVPAEDLLIANSIATVGGTLALLIGVSSADGSTTPSDGERHPDRGRRCGSSRR